MFFDSSLDIPKIAARTSCSIFVTPQNLNPKFKNALYLTPAEDKSTISVEQMRDFLAFTTSRETADRFFVIAPADAMNTAAANAFLKTFEEPNDHCHFVLLTSSLTALLPTIRSRAQIFILKRAGTIDEPPAANAKTLTLAKQLISATPATLPNLALAISKAKNPREHALTATATAIELLYKSYFKTGNDRFLHRLQPFLKLHQALSQNGHVKLQIVANLC